MQRHAGMQRLSEPGNAGGAQRAQACGKSLRSALGRARRLLRGRGQQGLTCFMLPVPEASMPAQEICWLRSAPGMITSALDTL